MNNMIIKDLPKKLRQLAMYRGRQEHIRYKRNINKFYNDYSDEDILTSLFTFSETPEGYSFWWNVNDGLITEVPK